MFIEELQYVFGVYTEVLPGIRCIIMQQVVSSER